MDSAIIAAIIGGVAVIIAAIIQRGASSRRDRHVEAAKVSPDSSHLSEAINIDRPRKKRWFLVLLAFVGFAFGGYSVGEYVYEATRDNPTALVCASVVWLLGLYLAYKLWKN